MPVSKPTPGATGWNTAVDAVIDIANSVADLPTRVTALEAGGIGDVTEAELAAGLATKAPTSHVHTDLLDQATGDNRYILQANANAFAQADATTTALTGKQPLDGDLTALAGLDSATAGTVASDGAGWVKKTYAQLKTALGLVKGDVGLGNVDNTSDANKPVSTATQTALNAKATASSLATIATSGKLADTTDLTTSGAAVGGVYALRKTSGGFATSDVEIPTRRVSAVRHPVRADVTKLRAPNAAPLAIPTYDGGNQLTHSSLLFDPEGWNGWRYWMVATPYAAGNSQVENPSIYVANDAGAVGGANGWQVPAGLTNPIDPYPGADGFNSDCDIEWGPDGKLYCFFRESAPSAGNTGTRERIHVRSSADGITWSASTTVIQNDEAVRRPVAPSVIWTGTKWMMWAVDIVPSPNVVLLYTNTSADPTQGTWTGPTTVTLTGLPGAPATIEPWHIDVNKWGDQYHMLVNSTTIDQSGAAGNLYFASSNDGGLTFACASTPVIPRRAWAWDANMYRSSAVPVLLGDEWGYEIIYAGYAAGPAYFLGHTFAGFGLHRRTTSGVVHGIADPDVANILAARLPLPPFTFGDAFQRADGATLGNAESGQAWTAQAGTPGIAGKQACATVAANTKAVLTGTADGYHETTVSVLGGQAWLMFRGTDATNYWRLGHNAGTLQLQKIIAGAGTTVAVLDALTAGTHLGVLCSGNTITPMVNGQAIDTFTDAFNATGTLIGFQTADTTARFGTIYSRTLVGGA